MFKKVIILLFFLFSVLNFANVIVVEDFSQDMPAFSKSVYIKKTRHSFASKRKEPRKIKREQKVVQKEFSSKENNRVAHKIKSHRKKRAKLLIIIDDVTSKRQIDFLQSLPFKVTPSIFPPSKMSYATPTLAKNLKHYMIHLPLQSKSRVLNKMNKTLFVYDSDAKIKKRVAELRRLFPNAKYVNNHTGSVFTSNYKKSKVLIKELHKQGFIFLDSRTTQYSKIKRINKELHLRYLKNDIYIDNTQSVEYILKQLKKGVTLAKKRGYAVVIGHPHPTTFKALKRLKPYLKDVETVYIDEF